MIIDPSYYINVYLSSVQDFLIFIYLSIEGTSYTYVCSIFEKNMGCLGIIFEKNIKCIYITIQTLKHKIGQNQMPLIVSSTKHNIR